MVKRLSFIMLLVLLSVPVASPAFAQDNNEVEDATWGAGAAIIDVTRNSRDTFGQGYLALDPTSTNGVSLYTISHVVDNADNTWVTIPILSNGQISFFSEQSEVDPSRWRCDTRSGDTDTACRVFLGEEAAEAAASGDYGVIPYIRQYAPRQLRVGAYIGSPRPDTGLWTVYRVTEIEDAEIHIEAVFMTVRGQSVPLGNFCHGRSGGPAVLITFNSRTGEVSPILRNGHPISVGELERGEGRRVPDYIDSTNRCYLDIVVNRVDTNH